MYSIVYEGYRPVDLPKLILGDPAVDEDPEDIIEVTGRRPGFGVAKFKTKRKNVVRLRYQITDFDHIILGKTVPFKMEVTPNALADPVAELLNLSNSQATDNDIVEYVFRYGFPLYASSHDNRIPNDKLEVHKIRDIATTLRSNYNKINSKGANFEQLLDRFNNFFREKVNLTWISLHVTPSGRIAPQIVVQNLYAYSLLNIISNASGNTPYRVCSVCSKFFKKKPKGRLNVQFCSDACRQADYRERLKAKRK